MLYVAQWRWALVYLLVAIGLAVAAFAWPGAGRELLAFELLFLLVGAVHAFRLAGRYPAQQARPFYSRWTGLLLLAAGLAVLAFAVRAFVVEPFRIPSSSMQPTLAPGVRILAAKWGYGNYGSFGFTLARRPLSAALARGDIVVFERPGGKGEAFVARLIGQPGDEIVFRGASLSLNGSPVPRRKLPEVYDADAMRYVAAFRETLAGVEYTVLEAPDRPPPMPMGDFPMRERCSEGADGTRCRIPEGHYFVMGDNRANSFDSRMWGFLPASHVMAKVVRVFD